MQVQDDHLQLMVDNLHDQLSQIGIPRNVIERVSTSKMVQQPAVVHWPTKPQNCRSMQKHQHIHGSFVWWSNLNAARCRCSACTESWLSCCAACFSLDSINSKSCRLFESVWACLATLQLFSSCRKGLRHCGTSRRQTHQDNSRFVMKVQGESPLPLLSQAICQA